MHHRRTSHRRFATARLSRLLVLVAAAIAGACGAGGAGSDLETARLEPVLELRIGSVDDPDDWLTRFDHLVVGPDGRIYTPHEQEKLIRVHDAEGRLVRAFGREGAGPGEFRRLDAIGLLGDTLWVFDMGNSRFSYFTLDGEPIGTIALPGRLTVMAATRDAVWGMELDDLDVPYIVRYGVRLAGDGATDRSRSS